MHLKRGLEREACDFCHRRKIKCDRSSRSNSKSLQCSQCELRQLPCKVDDSDDIRIQRKKRATRQYSTNTLSNQLNLPILDANYENTTQQLPPISFPVSHDPLEQPLEHQQNCDTTEDIWLSNALFDLSAENIFFLNQIFTGDATFEAYDMTQMDTTHNPQPIPSQIPLPDDSDIDLFTDLAVTCGVDLQVFQKAIHLYFSVASVSLPIIYENAFWVDSRSGQGSDSLVLAIVCCGMPFTNVNNKWELQQKAATKFKECFLESQNDANSQGRVCLDDIEALALMVDFTYDPAFNTSNYSHLQDMFLTHDSLVLMTLKYQNSLELGTGSLAQADERRTILFWHVYGRDAFHSLDQKTISRIPDEYANTNQRLPYRLGGLNYLDSVLSLAVIAREILHLLCSGNARRNGIRSQDLSTLYDRLYNWRESSWKPYLQRRKDNDGRLNPVPMDIRPQDGTEADYVSDQTQIQKKMQLQRLVLWALETNCYLQIESCVAEYGLAAGTGFDAEVMALHVDQESLRAAQDAVQTAEWMNQQESNIDFQGYHPVDLATGMLRNILVGVCNWLSIRGKRIASGNGGLSPFTIKTTKSIESKRYIDAANILLKIVGKAVSHQDTPLLVERMGEFVESLGEVATPQHNATEK